MRALACPLPIHAAWRTRSSACQGFPLICRASVARPRRSRKRYVHWDREGRWHNQRPHPPEAERFQANAAGFRNQSQNLETWWTCLGEPKNFYSTKCVGCARRCVAQSTIQDFVYASATDGGFLASSPSPYTSTRNTKRLRDLIPDHPRSIDSDPCYPC